MAVNAREAALKALGAFRRNGAWPEAYLNNLIIKEGLTERDAALASRLCYGVLQNKSLLDYYITGFSTVKLNKIEPLILDVLELSVYQLVFLDKIPASATVNEGVKLAGKAKNPRASGFVNAILRKISNNLDALPEISGNNKEEELSIRYSHPLPIIKLLRTFLDINDIEALLASNNEITPITAQVNTLKATTAEVIDMVTAEGAKAYPHPWLKDCILISGGGSLEKSKAFNKGLITVQDAAARVAVMASSPEPGQQVLDACSAPGGKAFAAAMLMGDSGSILASDIYEKKLPLIREGASRLGIKSISTSVMDASKPYPELFGKFDVVLADVPCSGLGIIRKKPEIRFKNPDELKGLPKIQGEIIENVSNYVKPGGVLMYSTCTLVPDENEGVVKAFLSRHEEFTPESFSLPEPLGEVSTGMLTLYPQIHGTDGFFMCKMRKR